MVSTPYIIILISKISRGPSPIGGEKTETPSGALFLMKKKNTLNTNAPLTYPFMIPLVPIFISIIFALLFIIHVFSLGHSVSPLLSSSLSLSSSLFTSSSTNICHNKWTCPNGLSLHNKVIVAASNLCSGLFASSDMFLLIALLVERQDNFG